MGFGKKSLPFVLSLAVHGIALVAFLWIGTHYRESVGVLSGLCSIRMVDVKARTSPKSEPPPPPVAASALRQSPPRPTRAETREVPPSAAENGARTPARPDTRNVPPPYPEEARRRGTEGTAMLLVRVARDGSAREVSLARTSGSPLLDAAAIEAVRRWRFRPASLGGITVESLVEVPIVFRLDRVQ